ncbi:hypothetical protein LEN26_003021 [Aphanomyces euteiches]|nr:hypothetical protein AeMF1_009637 [Aphanomyces euteiches]KAH9158359.1 hypothetical protein LEN26_003021 [Aphanomyces euteiches]KAH9197805.1 hypothetical protein AeNC1_000249 [Aphanomyces euteiches]
MQQHMSNMETTIRAFHGIVAMWNAFVDELAMWTMYDTFLLLTKIAVEYGWCTFWRCVIMSFLPRPFDGLPLVKLYDPPELRASSLCDWLNFVGYAWMFQCVEEVMFAFWTMPAIVSVLLFPSFAVYLTRRGSIPFAIA